MMVLQGFASLGGVLAEAPFRTFPEFIAPFLPALAGLVVALGIEAALRWRGNISHSNSWFAIACAVLCVFLLIWDVWIYSAPLATLLDSPDREGLQFRLLLLGFGALAVMMPVLAVLAGVRQIVLEWPFSGPLVSVLRLLPAPVVPFVLARQIPAVLRFFEGATFRLFS